MKTRLTVDLVGGSLGSRVDGETLSSGSVELSLSLGDRWSSGLGANTARSVVVMRGREGIEAMRVIKMGDERGWGREKRRSDGVGVT